MACDCNNYINCNDPKRSIETYSDNTKYTHIYNNTRQGTSMVWYDVSRTFSVDFGWDRHIELDHVLTGCDFNTTVNCDGSSEAKPYVTCSERCKMEKNIPYIWDVPHEIYLWKNITEELSFSINSTETAEFRTMWGNGNFHKVCIPNSIKTKGTEKFIMSVKGIQTEIAYVDYTYNPFPGNEGGGSTWGLYGNTISRTATPDTSNVACILLFPNPPKLAIPQDNDVIAYGFYDYNSISGGFTESSLPSDDGGKDYFYPYWLRAMPYDPIWRATADDRYNVIYSAGRLDLTGTSSWTPPSIDIYSMPVGSITLDSKENLMASLLLQFGEHVDSKGVVFNHSSISNVFDALADTGLSLNGKYNTVFPIGAM